MRKSLYWKLTLSFLLVAIISALLMVVFIRLTSVERLTQLLVDQQRSDMVEALATYYADSGSWGQVDQDWWKITSGPIAGGMVVHQEGGPQNGAPPNQRGRIGLFGLADSSGTVLVPISPRQQVGTQLSGAELTAGTQISVGGQPVGTLLIASRVGSFNPEEALFLQRTNQAILFGGLAALLVAVILGTLLARTLTRPLRALTQAAHQIGEGRLEQQVQVTSADEIGELATAFNTMSQEVARVNQMRKQMTADIAHDLRTPLTVIAGYIESMRDGVLQPTPQRLAVIYNEIEQMQNLVSDLRVLTLAESNELALHPQPVEPRALLERVSEVFQHRAGQQGLSLTVETGEGISMLMLDETRMLQVYDNLLSNAMRYTPAGGRVVLGARRVEKGVDLTVQDTGAGILAEELPYIFDRFHRADKSRHAEEGESGLGLAIVKAIVEAQHGKVWAESVLGKGVVVHMEFPTG